MAAKVDPKSITVDFGELKNDRMRNFKERIWYIKFWVELMKKSSDEEWSKGQKDLIDSQFVKGDWFYKNLEKTEEGRRKSDELKRERWKIRKLPASAGK